MKDKQQTPFSTSYKVDVSLPAVLCRRLVQAVAHRVAREGLAHTAVAEQEQRQRTRRVVRVVLVPGSGGSVVHSFFQPGSSSDSSRM